MGQFTLYANPNRQSCEAYPYLLDVQTPLLNDLSTRVVIPVGRLSTTGKPISGVSPVIEHEGERFVLYTQQLAGIPLANLGSVVANWGEHRHLILNAIDFLVSGI